MISGNSLMGRENELALIRRALGGGGGYAGVVIVGAAGVGKTRLAREVLARSATANDRVAWVVGTESARPLPLGAFSATISPAMPEALTSVRRLINSFVPQQRHGRVLVGVDDAHLLDGLSAHVVHQLAQSAGVRLVVTVRAGADEPDAVTALWKDGLLARLDLEPLSAEATSILIEKTLEGPVDSRTSRRFWKLTGGNALYLLQLLKDQVAAGRIRQVAGVWMWDGDVAVSQSITDMVGRQLGSLTPGPALVVDLLSQCEPLSVDVLCGLAQRSDLETAEQMRLVSVERTPAGLTARLAHPLYGELRRAAAGEMYLSSLRGRLARRLGEQPDVDMQATVRRALLTLESDLPPDPELYLEAARYELALLDPDAADRFASAAAAAEAGAAEAAPLRAMTMILLGCGDRAEEVLSEIGTGDRADSHHWATLRAANLTWLLGRPRDAVAILEALAAGPETDAELAARLAIEAGVDAVLGRCVAAEEKAHAALDSGSLTDLHAMLASIALMMALGALGRAEQIDELATRAIERAVTSFESSQMRFWFGGVHGRACRLNGRIDECVRWADELTESARDVPGLAHANLASLRAHAMLSRGAMRDAAKLLHEALAGAEQHGVTSGLRAASCFGLAEAHAKLGEADAARNALEEARRCVPDDYVYMQTNLSLATGWTLAAGGELTEAVKVAYAAARDARDRGQPTHELACVQAIVLWGDTSMTKRARELADSLRLPLADVVARHAEALHADDGAGLLDASMDYQAGGDRAAAADSAAQAAVAYTRSGQSRRGKYAATLAQQIADDCGGLCTPALRNPAGQPLTQRQREIVELVCADMSNKEIAERLVMSVRSVEGHIYRACQRVGATSREELARILRRGPLGGW